MTPTPTYLLAAALGLAIINLAARSKALLFILNTAAAIGFGALIITTK